MLHVKVKSKEVSFSIPVPYMMLNLGISIVCSNMLQRHINKWSKEYIEKKNIPFIIPPLDKAVLKLVVDEIKNHNGLELVNIKANDGSEVRIKL